MSIFNKICPRCAGDLPIAESRCQCGFVFDASATTGSYQAIEIAIQEAEVYAEYLQVRMRQAREIAEVSIAEQVRTPDDPAKSGTARQANEHYLAARAEYDEQMKLLTQLRRQAETALQLSVQEEKHAWARAEDRAKEKRSVQVKHTKASPAPASRTMPSAPAAKTAKPAKTATVATAAKRATKSTNIGGPAPTPKMRQKMALAAENATDRLGQTRAVTPQRTSAPQATTPGERIGHATNTPARPSRPAGTDAAVFRQKQASQIKKGEKECPNCTAVVAMTAKECKCGFGFTKGAQSMDGVSLSDEDRTRLLDLFQPARNS